MERRKRTISNTMTSITRAQSIPVRVVAREKPTWRLGKFLRGLLSRIACIQMHFTLSDLQADHMLGSDEHNEDVSLSVSRTNAVKHVLDLKEDRPANNRKTPHKKAPRLAPSRLFERRSR